MRQRILFSTLGLIGLASVYASPASAYIAETATYGAILAGGDLVGGRLINRAKDSANSVVAQAAAELKSLIDYARWRYSDALNETLDGVDTQERKFFYDLRSTINKADELVADQVENVNEIIVSLGIVASQLPGSRWGFITTYHPRFILPSSASRDPQRSLTVRGNGFSEAATRCKVNEAGTCTVTVVSDGELRLTLDDILTATDPQAVALNWVTLWIEQSPRYWFLGGSRKAMYTLPIYRLPQQPVALSVFPVSERFVVAQTMSESHGEYHRSSGRSNHRSGCHDFASKGSLWAVDLRKSKIANNRGDNGSVWIDKKRSNEERLRVCWTSKPAKKHIKKGYVKYDVVVVQNRRVVERFVEGDAYWTVYVDWSRPAEIILKGREFKGWYIVGDTVWGDEFGFDSTDENMPIEVNDQVKEKGLLRVWLKGPEKVLAIGGFAS